MKRVDKGWGYELWIANSSLYCGKLLHFEQGKRCSLHYHKIKDETFYLHSGKILLRIGSTTRLLYPGDSEHIPPGMPHQMYAIEESDLYEFSTEHFDEDSIRIEKGD